MTLPRLTPVATGAAAQRATATTVNAIASQVNNSTPINVKSFGAVGDGVTNDGPAFTKALAALAGAAVNVSSTYKGTGRLFIPAGNYYLGSTVLDIFETLIIEGEGSGQAGGIVSKLTWAANTDGFRVQRYNTDGVGNVSSPTHTGGDGCIIRGLYLNGGFTTAASEGDYNGIRVKARCLIQDCCFNNWQGDGIHIVAIAGGGVPYEGNANGWAVERCRFTYCQNGLYISGSDTNAGYSLACDFANNRQWGLWDNSFLGNAHYSHQSANNGFADNGLGGPPYLPPTVVSYSGNRYYCIVGQETWCSTNAPSGTATDNQGWGYYSAGGVLGASIPAWASGTTYRSGGSYRTDNANAIILLSNCYGEGGEGVPQLNAGQTLVLGGIWGSSLGQSGGCLLTGTKTRITAGKDFKVGRNLTVVGNSSQMGPMSGAAADNTLNLTNTNSLNWITMDTYTTGGALSENTGYIFSESGQGVALNGVANLRFRTAGTERFRIDSFGPNITGAGAVLKVAGTQVVTARQTGWAAWTGTGSTASVAVSSATTAQCAAAIKSIIDALITHGLIGT